MQKKWKTGLAVAAGLLLALSVNAGLAGAEGCLNGQTVAYADEVEFEIDENGQLIKYHGAGGDVVIPDGVTAIVPNAFQDCDSVISVIIPNGTTSINPFAFNNCSNLKKVVIPESVTEIGTYAFWCCAGLEEIELPGVTIIGECAFGNCTSLETVKLSTRIDSIESSAFTGCSSLVNINIPDSITSIQSHTFSGCSSLVNIELPDSVTGIGYGAFWGCSSLTSIKIPNGVEMIEGHTFADCSSLKCIEIPSSCVSISTSFDGCISLTDVYYTGTQEAWEAIEIPSADSDGDGMDDNAAIFNATIHYETTMPDEETPENPSVEDTTEDSTSSPSENPGDTSIEEEPAPGTGDNMVFTAMVMLLSMAASFVVILLTGKKQRA